jgi:hypothetical protein
MPFHVTVPRSKPAWPPLIPCPVLTSPWQVTCPLLPVHKGQLVIIPASYSKPHWPCSHPVTVVTVCLSSPPGSCRSPRGGDPRPPSPHGSATCPLLGFLHCPIYNHLCRTSLSPNVLFVPCWVTSSMGTVTRPGLVTAPSPGSHPEPCTW